MRGACLALALGAALVAAGEASARQSGYVFLQCDLTGEDAGLPAYIFRIGNGRWDRIGDGAWYPAEGIACGEVRASEKNTCTFNETMFMATVEYYGAGTGTTVTTIDRYSGQYVWMVRSSSVPVAPVRAQCRPIAEPKTAKPLF
jgi:hypothetical protein